jgi:hypothetical protein
MRFGTFGLFRRSGILGGESGAAREQQPAQSEPAPAARGYSYQVQVHPRSGVLRRWRGRVVTTDAQGRRRHWRWQHGFSKTRLMANLWEETMRDIQWRTGGHAVEVVESAE